jgi:hypothetical protein
MMWCHRRFASSFIVACSLTTVIGLSPGVASAADGMADVAAASLRVEIRSPHGVSDGTCVLIHQTRDGNTVLGYLLTAQRLFDPDVLGTWRPHELLVRVFLGDTVVEADGSQVTFSAETDQPLGLAVIKVVMSRAQPAIAPLSVAPPDRAAAFVIRPFSQEAIAVGDDAAAPGHCLGAPAISNAGVFGIATECAPDRAPAITTLAAARTFLLQVLPMWKPSPEAPPIFRVEHRNVDPYLNDAGCEQKTSVFDVPVHLTAQETIVGATATVGAREGISLGEVTVMNFDDRAVRLRFRMPANRPAWQTELCGPDHALVTVGVDILVMRR